MENSEDVSSISESRDVEHEHSSYSSTQTSGDLFLLPEEVQEVVLHHVDVKDLVACCRVCRLWRTGINVSHIWKKWCRIESYKPELMEKHLEDQAENDDYSNMGWWRKVYCWHAKLDMNWRRKTCQKFKLVDSDSSVYCFDTDGNVAATGHENSSVVVWSIKVPPIIIGRFDGVLINCPINSVRVQGNLVVVLQRRLIQVYCKADDKQYKLTDLKCFEMGETNVDHMDNFVKHKDEYSSWYFECLRAHDRMAMQSGLIYSVQGSTLYASTHHSKSVWAWNLPGSEVQFSVRTVAEVCQILKDQQGEVYFVARDQVTYLMKYELGSDTPNLLITVPGLKNMVVGDELVLALPAPGDVTLKRVWAYSKGDYSQPIGTRTLSGFVVVAILPPRLVVYSDGTNITVWDPVSNVNCAQIALSEPVSYLKPTFASFLLVFKNRSLYLWDWKKGKRLYRVYNQLEWSGNYSNLLWGNATTILSGGVANQLEMISFLCPSTQQKPEDDVLEPSASGTMGSSATIV